MLAVVRKDRCVGLVRMVWRGNWGALVPMPLVVLRRRWKARREGYEGEAEKERAGLHDAKQRRDGFMRRDVDICGGGGGASVSGLNVAMPSSGLEEWTI